MADRYRVVEYSQSAHCCFTHTVVDTTKPWAAYLDEDREEKRFEAVCETFEKEEAELVCRALNALPPT